MILAVALAMSAQSTTVAASPRLTRAKAFARVMASAKSERELPFVRSLRYEQGPSIRAVPKTFESFAASVVDCVPASFAERAASEKDVYLVTVKLNCPEDAQHANNQIAYYLRFEGGDITVMFLQFGFPPVYSPPEVRGNQ